jgi:signal recognition particle receptor protein ftsY
MQASKYILMRLFIFGAVIFSTLLSGCGEKTPEQIAAENKKQTELSVRRARVLMFEEKSSDAIKLLEETYQNCGNSADLSEALAYAYMQNGQIASAAMFFENASNQKGGDPDLQISAAKAYEQSKAFDSAAKAYEKYLKLKPADTVAWKALSECFAKQQKYQEALNAMMSSLKAAGRNPNTAEASQIGNLFVKTGNAVQGRKWLEAAYKATLPENVETRKEILLGLVTVYLAQKETALLDEAVAELDKIEPHIIDKKYPALHKQLKDFRDAIQAAQEAVKANELKLKEEEAAKQKAEAEAKAAAEKKAKEDAEAAAKQQDKNGAENPANAENKDLTTMEAADVIKTEDAPVIHEADIKDETHTPAKPTDYDVLVQKCYDAIASGNAEEAEKSAHLAIAKNAEPEAAWRALAKAYEMSNKNYDSYMASAEAYKRNPDDIDATLFYIRNASRVYNNEKFLNIVYRAYEKFPNNPEIWVDLARTYKLLGDKRNSTFFYNHFLTYTPKEHILYEEMSEEFKQLSATK